MRYRIKQSDFDMPLVADMVNRFAFGWTLVEFGWEKPDEGIIEVEMTWERRNRRGMLGMFAGISLWRLVKFLWMLRKSLPLEPVPVGSTS